MSDLFLTDRERGTGSKFGATHYELINPFIDFWKEEGGEWYLLRVDRRDSPLSWRGEWELFGAPGSAILCNLSLIDEFVFQGWLTLRHWAEDHEAVFLSKSPIPLAEQLEWMSGKTVTVRYWITDRPCSRYEADEAAILTAMGVADVGIEARYGDLTGYLWTDEDLNVGGHDLMAELKSSVGKWLILEVQKHDEVE